MYEYILNFLTELMNLINEMSPYLLLGFLFAGILHVFFPSDQVQRYLGKRSAKSAFNAALLGVPLPLCSCGVIPTGISFYKNGASKGSTVSFLISTPQTGVDSILVTYSLLGLPLAIIRPIIALVTGFIGGVFTNSFDKVENPNTSTGFDGSNLSTTAKVRSMFKYAFVDFLQDISKWLIIGLLIAAVISVLIPEGFFTTYVNNPFLSMLIVLAASVPLYVCATGSVPIAAVLMAKGLSPGAAIVFLMAGPATNAATITLIGKVMGKRTLTAYLASIIGGALLFGVLVDWLLPVEWFSITGLLSHAQHGDHLLPQWLKIASSVTLVALIINGYIQKYRPVKQESLKTPVNMEFELVKQENGKAVVNGMTCNHCKANVERNLQKIEGIESVTADIIKNEIVVVGENVDWKKIEETVNDLGYEFGGKMA